MSREGIDFAFTPHPSPAAVKKAGKTFVCRYLAGGKGGSKELTKAEAVSFSKAGVDLVVVWETTAGRAGERGRAGAPDARAAKVQAKQVGVPDDRPIYFAVDFDASGSQVEAYFKAVANVIGVKRAGVYGSYRVCQYLFDKKLVSYAWQTYAWSGGKVDPRAQLYQYSNGHTVGGADVDYDRALHSDFGQWRVGSPTPAPAPKPAPSPSRLWWRNEAEVKRVQVNVDWFFRAQHIPHERIAADGVLGEKTKEAIKSVKFLLGYTKPFVVWATGTYSEMFFRRIHHPTYGLTSVAVKRGLARRNAARKPADSLQALASAVLSHPNARFSFWSPTGGSARDGLERTARGEKAYVAATRRYVTIDKRIIAFCLDLCQVAGGAVLINCITNGHHMSGSQHYSGQAVDIDKSSSGLGRIYAAASRHGLTVLNEDSYHFHVHT